MSKGRDFKVDSVKFEFWLPDLMQTLQIKWFVSKGQRLPIGHSTQRHQLSASRRLHSELTYLNSSHRSHNVAIWEIMMVGYPWFFDRVRLKKQRFAFPDKMSTLLHSHKVRSWSVNCNERNSSHGLRYMQSLHENKLAKIACFGKHHSCYLTPSMPQRYYKQGEPTAMLCGLGAGMSRYTDSIIFPPRKRACYCLKYM